MRLGKTTKFNMIIAILLCMAFVVNLGATYAAMNYNFNASSVNSITIQNDAITAIDYNTYTDYGHLQGTSGKYIYSTGTVNNQLNINYGFRTGDNIAYDLMIGFTATYTDSSHSANDFSLNFANRDMWIVDTGITNGLKVSNGQTVVDNSQVYYNLTSSSNSISGEMYYMGSLSGSGVLPVISGVNFYTSPNGSYTYVGDTLTITLNPEYVRVDTANYQTASKHKFYTTSEAFNDWIAYKSGAAKVAEDPIIMKYNAYVYNKASGDTVKTTLNFPYDSEVLDSSTALVKPNADSPVYPNTAYRYTVNNDGSQDYQALTAGNKYYGGLGVYVIPNTGAADADKVVTVGIKISYVWQKNGVIAGTTPSGIVSPVVSSDITTITSNDTNSYYYCEQITKPTYINVLEYIRLTAENYESIVQQGYSLILNYIDVVPVTASDNVVSSNVWTSRSRNGYTINNASQTSGILVKVSDVAEYEKYYQTNLSITNNTDSVLKISSFSLKGYLWYGAYTSATQTIVEDDGQGGQTSTETIVEQFVETPLGTGEQCYLRNEYIGTSNEEILTASDIWDYDTSLWSGSEEGNVYTFNAINADATYIPKGYTMMLIKGVTIPKTVACVSGGIANDFWCSIQDVTISATSAVPTYANVSSTTGIETIVDGYYNEITSSKPGHIYIRNNTNQVITGLALSSLDVYSLESGSTLPRDRMDSLLTGSAVTVTNHLNNPDDTSLSSGTISIKPHEMVLAYTIETNQSAVISTYNLTATLEAKAEDNALDLIYNATTSKGEIINNSSSYYEFRLTSASKINNFASGNMFIEQIAGGKYYYYYKGIICPNQCITIFSGGDFESNITISTLDLIAHDSSWNAEHYVASNYEAWGLEDEDGLEWLSFMARPHTKPTATERENAIVVPKAS